jgi:hypothetical protein
MDAIPVESEPGESFQESPSDIVLELRGEQHESWRDDCPVRVEELLARSPRLAEDDDAVIELLYSEFQLREQYGEQPRVEEYLERFPRHAPRLERLFELHRLIEDHGSLSDEAVDVLEPLMPVPVLYRNDQPPEKWCREITAVPLVVGRERSAAVRLHDASISRHHCLIWRDGPVCRLEDSGSTNGVYVNGERVSGGCELYPGDVIRISKYMLVVGLQDQ